MRLLVSRSLVIRITSPLRRSAHLSQGIDAPNSSRDMRNSTTSPLLMVAVNPHASTLPELYGAVAITVRTSDTAAVTSPRDGSIGSGGHWLLVRSVSVSEPSRSFMGCLSVYGNVRIAILQRMYGIVKKSPLRNAGGGEPGGLEGAGRVVACFTP